MLYRWHALNCAEYRRLSCQLCCRGSACQNIGRHQIVALYLFRRAWKSIYRGSCASGYPQEYQRNRQVQKVSLSAHIRYFPLLFKRVYLKELVQIASDSIHYWTLLTYFPTYNCSSSIETNRIWQMALFPNSDTGSLAFLARWIQ